MRGTSALPGLVSRCRVSCSLERPVTLAAGVIGNGHRRATNVVVVVPFRELEAANRSITGYVPRKRALAFLVRSVRGVDVYFDDVRPRWDVGLAIATVEDEVLTTQEPPVGVRPTLAHTLEPMRLGRAAAPVRPTPVTSPRVVRVSVEHAEAALRRTPHLACSRLDQSIGRVVLEVEVVVARCEFEHTILVTEVAIAVRVHMRDRVA